MSRAVAIVVTYDSAGEIGAALAALHGADVDVIVVDNASRDATVGIVGRDHPEVVLIVNERNVGFATAVNIGLAVIAGTAPPVVLLVNPDCVIEPTAVAGLVGFLDDHPHVGVAGPRLVGADGRVAVSAHPFETLTSVVLSRFGGALVPVRVRRALSGSRRREAYDACRTAGEPVSVDWLSGACLAVRTDLLCRTGGLDERYFMYYEDEELCWQAHRLGRDVVHVPAWSATHVGGASSVVGATWPHLYRSMFVFFADHRPATATAVRVVVVVRACAGIATATVRRLLGHPSGPERARAWRQVAAVAWHGPGPDRCAIGAGGPLGGRIGAAA